jgi:hypothetical protein
MTDLTRVSAAFRIVGGGACERDLDITGLTPDEIADLVFVTIANPSLCHQCVRDISDPEVEELTEFTVNGVDYNRDGEHWVVAS